MAVISKELTQTDIEFVSSEDVAEKIPANTLILELENMPEGFDARDLDEYIEKELGNIIRRTGVADGVTMSSSVAIIGLKDMANKEDVKTKLEEMWVKPLADVRDETGREKKVVEIEHGRI